MSKEAIEHYEAALKEAFSSGATGNVFHHWNEARKALAEQQKLVVTNKVYVTREQLAELYPPPQRTWVGLTDDEILYCVELENPKAIAEEVEAKLRERNT